MLAAIVLPVLGSSSPSAAATAAPLPTLHWTDAAAFVQNTGWNSSVARCSPVSPGTDKHGSPCAGPYARLPLAAKTGEWCSPPCPVRSIVWGEGQNGAGLYLGFVSDSPTIWLNATLLSPAKEATNCGSTCGSGLDMYAYDEATKAWRWVDTTTNSNGGGWSFVGSQISRPMVAQVPASRGPVRYRIHLPIYNGLSAAAIGVPPGKKILPYMDADELPAVLFNGTSIVNGHVASRPGMIFTNALSRRRDNARSVLIVSFLTHMKPMLYQDRLGTLLKTGN
jgi:hypothetical protein